MACPLIRLNAIGLSRQLRSAVAGVPGSTQVQHKKKAGMPAAAVEAPPALLVSALLAALATAGRGEAGLLSTRLDLYANAELAAVHEECEELAAGGRAEDAWAAGYAQEAETEITGTA